MEKVNEVASMKKLLEKLYAIQHSALVFVKDGENPFFKSKYLTLDKLVETLKPELKKHKLLIVHKTLEREVVTLIIDIETTFFYESKFPIPEDLKPQEMGSAITYAKRYNLGQLFNIVTDEDDDGNKSSATKKETKTKEAPEKSPVLMSDGQRKKIFAMLKTLGKDKDWLEGFAGEVEHITKKKALQLIDGFQKKIDAKK